MATPHEGQGHVERHNGDEKQVAREQNARNSQAVAAIGRPVSRSSGATATSNNEAHACIRNRELATRLNEARRSKTGEARRPRMRVPWFAIQSAALAATIGRTSGLIAEGTSWNGAGRVTKLAAALKAAVSRAPSRPAVTMKSMGVCFRFHDGRACTR